MPRLTLRILRGLNLGISLRLILKVISKTFVVKEFFKDAFMGSDLIGLKRFIISQHDYDEIKQSVPEEKWIQFWSFVKNSDENQSDLATEFSKSNILSDFDIDKTFVELMFMTDRIMSAILFIVSLFLIFIAFLTLRFTIVSTIQDDYKEIGVMKAIGVYECWYKEIVSYEVFRIICRWWCNRVRHKPSAHKNYVMRVSGVYHCAR